MKVEDYNSKFLEILQNRVNALETKLDEKAKTKPGDQLEENEPLARYTYTRFLLEEAQSRVKQNPSNPLSISEIKNYMDTGGGIKRVVDTYMEYPDELAKTKKAPKEIWETIQRGGTSDPTSGTLAGVRQYAGIGKGKFSQMIQELHQLREEFDNPKAEEGKTKSSWIKWRK